MKRLMTIGWAIAAAAIFTQNEAQALINPKFTPVHLVQQSGLIAELQLNAVKDGKFTGTVKRALKGKADGAAVSFDLTTSAYAEHVKAIEKMVGAQGSASVVFFVGEFQDREGAGGGADAGQAGAAQKGFLHIAGSWVTFFKGKIGAWEMDEISTPMLGTWNGATEMLLQATEYILAEPDADLPVSEGADWKRDEIKQFAKVEGAVHAALPVDLTGTGKFALYVASEGGDHLFELKGKELQDVTAAHKLSAKSRVATWGDVNGDGRMDLISFDGEAIGVFTQAADGTFQAGKKLAKAQLPDGCLSLGCMDSGKPGKPAVLIGTKGWPAVWAPDEEAAPRNLGGADAPAKELGAPGRCLLADLDGDANPDLLQLFANGSLIHKGKAPAQFEAAQRGDVALGAGQADAFFGDYDADGLLDIFTVASDDSTRLWNNRGKFKFVETMMLSGELSYKGSSGAIGGATVDFNNDGRQDVLFYYAATSPHLYFSRGFRSFGHANSMDVGMNGLLPQAEEGEQAACFADLNGDNVPDMVLVLKNGEAWVFWCDTGSGSANVARGALPSQGPYLGPLTVTGWQAKRCLGAWNVIPGLSEAWAARTDAGPLSLRWQMPGGKSGKKDMVLENSAVRFAVAP